MAKALAITLVVCCSLQVWAHDPVKLQVREGRPVIDGVYVNSHGPYRFLIDTGTSSNMIDPKLAREIGLKPEFRVELASLAGSSVITGNRGNEVQVGGVSAKGLEFLFADFETIRTRWPDVRGVLGQGFLSQFDYRMDLKAGRLEFGAGAGDGPHESFRVQGGRALFTTSLGDLVLDSGAEQVVLFRRNADRGTGTFLKTVAGTQAVGFVSSLLRIAGRAMWHGDAVAVPTGKEPGVDGLMPVSIFRSVYVSNSGSYAVFE